MPYAFIKRKDFIPTKKIQKRVKRSIEHGMYQRMIWTVETLDFTEGLSFLTEGTVAVKKKTSPMRDCFEYSRKLKMKEVEFQAIKVVNIEKFTLVFLALISICCMAFIVELLSKKEIPSPIQYEKYLRI